MPSDALRQCVDISAPSSDIAAYHGTRLGQGSEYASEDGHNNTSCAFIRERALKGFPMATSALHQEDAQFATKIKSSEISREPKLTRGESQSLLVEDASVHCFVRLDEKRVFFINVQSVMLLITCQVKRKNKDGSLASVQCRGGVDVVDAKCKAFFMQPTFKKWWHHMFYYLLDICIVNAHIEQCHTPHQTVLTQK